MSRQRVVLGTRGSKLALVQAELVRSLLGRANPGLQVDLAIITTKGDAILDRALSRIGDKGLFVKEIETALIDGQIDLAVHSCKDLPSETPPELMLAAFPPRADARDALISRHGVGLAGLPPGARIGTSSLRRACQLQAFRPDFEVVNLRGNVDTRLRKAAGDEYDAIVLAVAGLDRLGLLDAVTEYLEPEVMLPAVAQGALAIECRAGDDEVREMLPALDDPVTRPAVLAERAFLRRLEGGCQVPIAAHATLGGHGAEPAGYGDDRRALRLRGLIGTVDGVQVIRGEREGSPRDAEAIGRALAEDLLERGGDAILANLEDVSPKGAKSQRS